MEYLMEKINEGTRLDFEESTHLFEAMVKGELTNAQIASALIALRTREESEDELAGLVTVLNRYKRPFKSDVPDTIDTCGTGGDGKSTVNISTAVSIILASLGFPVVKHGNTAQSGTVGSADILTMLGMDIRYEGISPEEYFKKNNFVFLLAPQYHPALKQIGSVRRELKVPTIFNMAGPLANPADPTCQIIGISRLDRVSFIARTLLKLNRDNVTVYASRDGYDEVSSREKTDCVHIKNGSITEFSIDPADFFTPRDMPIAHSADEAKAKFLAGINGEDIDIANVFALNAALAIKTLKGTELKDGFHTVKKAIAKGTVKNTLNELIDSGKACAGNIHVS